MGRLMLAVLVGILATLPLLLAPAYAQYSASARVIIPVDIVGANAADCMQYMRAAFAELNEPIARQRYSVNVVDRYLDAVRCEESTGDYPYQYGYVVVQNATYFLPKIVYAYDTPTWVAGNLVHESCHIRQFEQGRPNWGYDAEMECSKLQLAALRAMAAPLAERQYVQSLLTTTGSTGWWS